MSEKNITAKECRFVVHVPTKSPQVPDLHLIKERIHYDDGSSEPNVRLVYDYKRPFYVTKKSFQNHHSKKEWDSLDHLNIHNCTQSELRYRVATALEKPWSRDSLKVLSQSPYLYGTDISSMALIKKAYKDKWPEKTSGYTTAVYDIETDMVWGTSEIILATIAFQDKVFTAATKRFMQGLENAHFLVQNKFASLLQEFIEKRNLKLEFVVVDNPAQAVIEVFKKANEWKPDFLAIWNMDFDIPRTIQAVLDARLDPAQELSDPCVPKEHRMCFYKEGRRKKITASGRVIPINPSSQWHTLILTSSFYVIDAMCSYKLLRTPPGQEEPSYSLDFILNKEMKYGKLKFKEADQYLGAQWHEVMQSRFKFEYIIYNIFDCVGILEMNDKTKDLSYSLPSFAGVTEFERFNSNPKKIHDALHFFCLERNLVISASGSAPKQNQDDEDVEIDFTEESNASEESEEEKEYEILNLKGWIVTLPAHLTTTNGLPIIEEDPQMRPNIRGYNFDSDCSSAYPSATIGCNVSKETTRKELSSVEGIDEQVFRLNGINLVYGPINAIEYCTEMFNFPTLHELDDLIKT